MPIISTLMLYLLLDCNRMASKGRSRSHERQDGPTDGGRAGRLASLALSAGLALIGAAALQSSPAQAASAVSCGGAAMLGGAQITCSHVDPRAPTQFCTFSWSLADSANVQRVVEGTFLLPPGSSNATVYQGSGFAAALSQPIVLCQGRRSRG